jgi:hypothetical protein
MAIQENNLEKAIALGFVTPSGTTQDKTYIVEFEIAFPGKAPMWFEIIGYDNKEKAIEFYQLMSWVYIHVRVVTPSIEQNHGASHNHVMFDSKGVSV